MNLIVIVMLFFINIANISYDNVPVNGSCCENIEKECEMNGQTFKKKVFKENKGCGETGIINSFF